MIMQPLIPTLPIAPAALGSVVIVGAVCIGVATWIAMQWATRQARTSRAIAEAAGQLVAVRPIAGGPCTPVCVPRLFEPLFVTSPSATDEVLPAWQPEVAVAIDQLARQVMASPTQSATMECEANGQRLRLVGARISDGAQLLVSLSEAGPDVARVNSLESAALLSAGVAHDLLNVLNTLVLHAEVGHERANAPVARTHFDRIRTGGARAAELVSLMRRYLRGEMARGPVAPVRIGAIVEEVVELLRPTIPRGLELSLALDPEATVLAESVHLHQVVLNLVVNAVQALEGRTSPRVVISVTRGPGDLGTGELGTTTSVVELVVVDNGPGLPIAMRERCFEPFVTTKAARKGTGIGLAVVRALVVDTLRGSVVVDDAPGGGARFIVRLPDAVPPLRPTREIGEQPLTV